MCEAGSSGAARADAGGSAVSRTCIRLSGWPSIRAHARLLRALTFRTSQQPQTNSSSVGAVGAFEVTVNGRLAYSKLSTGAFPNFPALAGDIAGFARTGVAPAGWR